MTFTLANIQALLPLLITAATTVFVMLAIAIRRNHWWNATVTVVGSSGLDPVVGTFSACGGTSINCVDGSNTAGTEVEGLSYQIMYVKREKEDRTILTKGILSSLFETYGSEENGYKMSRYISGRYSPGSNLKDDYFYSFGNR